MKKMNNVKQIVPLVLSLGLAACGGNDAASPAAEDVAGADAAINLAPVTLDQAGDTLARLEALSKREGGREQALEALRQLQPRLDQLNHLVARVEAAPGHTVSFYETSPGVIDVSERSPAHAQRLLSAAEFRGATAVDLFQRIAKAEAPESLRAAEARSATRTALANPGREVATRDQAELEELAQLSPPSAQGMPAAQLGENVATSQQALTGADGQWFRDHACFKTGNSKECLPNWWNGGWAQNKTKTSFFTLAEFAGDWVQVRMQRSGTTSFADPVFLGEWLSWWGHGVVDESSCFPWACAVGNLDYLTRTIRWDILQATGDGFHWSYSYKWTCSTVDSCDTWP